MMNATLSMLVSAASFYAALQFLAPEELSWVEAFSAAIFVTVGIIWAVRAR